MDKLTEHILVLMLSMYVAGAYPTDLIFMETLTATVLSTDSRPDTVGLTKSIVVTLTTVVTGQCHVGFGTTLPMLKSSLLMFLQM